MEVLMEKDNYKKRLLMFRRRASFYQQFEARMKTLESRSAIREPETSYAFDEYAMLQSNNTYVRCVLTRIKDNYGSDAANIIVQNYIEGCPQKEISHDRNVSLRTLQRHMHKWLMEGLNNYDQ